MRVLPRQARCQALLGVMVLAACGGTPTEEPAHFDALPALTAEPGLRIGALDDADRGFSRISGVEVDRDGNVYVGEAIVPEIRVYGPGGELLRRIGRGGDGPGEFEGMPRFGVAGDTVWTLDYRSGRIALFDREGEVLSTGRTGGVQVPLPRGFGYVIPWEMRSDGTFTGHFGRVSYNRNGAPTGVQPTDSIPWPIVLFDPSGAVVDTAGWAPRPPARMWRPPSEEGPGIRTIEAGGRRRIVPRPPPPLPRWEPLADGYVVVETPTPEAGEDGTITVARLGLDGDTVFSRRLRYRPEPYTEADLDTIAAKAARGESGGMVPFMPTGNVVPNDWEAVAASFRAAMEFPPFRLPVQNAWVAQDGSIWLRRADPAGTTARWVVLDPDGRPRGQLELPADVRPAWSRGDTVWAVTPDEVGVPWLVRYTVGAG